MPLSILTMHEIEVFVLHRLGQKYLIDNLSELVQYSLRIRCNIAYLESYLFCFFCILSIHYRVFYDYLTLRVRMFNSWYLTLLKHAFYLEVI